MKYQCKYCPAKFGRKHLLFSHESIKHSEEYAKKEKLYKLLASQPAIAAPQNSWISRTNKGRKLGPFLDDTDQLLDRLGNKNEELPDYPDYVQEDPMEYDFNLSSDEYEKREEVVACQVIQECMEQ